jgi:disulfide bond formation protein DsbB
MRPGIILFISLTCLSCAYIAQYAFGLKPCVLCLYQRIPYALAAALAVIGIIYKKNFKIFFLLIFLSSTLLASYHVAVEQHIMTSKSCSNKLDFASNIEELNKQLSAQDQPSCDKVEFAFLGISFAGWNLLLSLCLSIAIIIGIRNEKTKITRGSIKL